MNLLEVFAGILFIAVVQYIVDKDSGIFRILLGMFGLFLFVGFVRVDLVGKHSGLEILITVILPIATIILVRYIGYGNVKMMATERRESERVKSTNVFLNICSFLLISAIAYFAADEGLNNFDTENEPTGSLMELLRGLLGM